MYLIFCWTLIPSVLGIIEFFIYLTMSDYNFDLEFNTKYSNVRPKKQEPEIEFVSLYDPTTTESVSFKEALRRIDLASTKVSKEQHKRQVSQMDEIVKKHRCSIHNKPIKYGYTFEYDKLKLDIIAKCCRKSKEELEEKLKKVK